MPNTYDNENSKCLLVAKHKFFEFMSLILDDVLLVSKQLLASQS